MYNPEAVLAAIDDHKWKIFVLACVSIVSNYIWFVEALRVARRDRCYSIPLFCIMFWFAHDASYLYRFSDWFHGNEHWYPKLFWVAIVVTNACEIAFIAQVIRYARKELAPGLAKRTFTVALAAAIVGSVLLWEVVKGSLGDPLYIVSFGLCVAAYPPFGIALVIRRGSRQGQSVLMWVAFVVTGVAWFIASTVWFTPEFREWRWIALGIVSTLWAVAATLVVSRAPAYVPPELETLPPASRGSTSLKSMLRQS